MPPVPAPAAPVWPSKVNVFTPVTVTTNVPLIASFPVTPLIVTVSAVVRLWFSGVVMTAGFAVEDEVIAWPSCLPKKRSGMTFKLPYDELYSVILRLKRPPPTS